MAETTRLAPRLGLHVSVEYEGFERFQPDHLLNVSPGGAFIISSKPLSIGRSLQFRFELPELPGHLIRAYALVVWQPKACTEGAGSRHPAGMGLKFLHLKPEMQSLLDQYVNVSMALRTLDERIGGELPSHLLAQLPVPEEFSEVDLTEFHDQIQI